MIDNLLSVNSFGMEFLGSDIFVNAEIDAKKMKFGPENYKQMKNIWAVS